MKFTADRLALSAALKRASRVVMRASPISILEAVRLSATNDGIELLGTDMDIWLRSPLNGEITDEGVCCVKLGPLAGFVSALQGGKVDLAVEKTDLAVYCGTSRAAFPLLNSEDYPVVSKSPQAEPFFIGGKELSRLIGFALPFVSNEPSRAYLGGVHLHNTNAGIAAVATNGHVLAAAQLGGTFAQFPPVTIPTKTADIIEGDGEVELSIDESRISVAGAEFSLTSKLMDGTFPEYGRAIAPKGDSPATFSAEEFILAARQIESATDDTVNGGRSRAIKLSVGKQSVVLSGGRAGSGMARAEIAASYSGDPCEIGFQGQYLRGAIEAIGKDGEVEFHFRDPSYPARFCKPRAEFDHVTILPLRV